MIKSIVRRGIRGVRRWIQEPPKDPIAEERQRFRNCAYGELNALTLQIMAAKQEQVRPHFTWGVLHAAHLAKTLKLPAISVIEFGVAGGNGLLALETCAACIEESLGVKIEVYGFDTGQGLPKPVDYRDLPNIYAPSSYPMNPEKLRSKLRRAKLILGLIRETLPRFFAEHPAPVGFVSIDVDLYSSTMDAFQLLEAEQRWLLPRIYCYFDDILGFTFASFNGERLAIEEFNQTHPMRKISPIHGVSHFVPLPLARDPWVECMFLAHILDHSLYCLDDGLVNHSSDLLDFVLPD